MTLYMNIFALAQGSFKKTLIHDVLESVQPKFKKLH